MSLSLLCFFRSVQLFILSFIQWEFWARSVTSQGHSPPLCFRPVSYYFGQSLFGKCKFEIVPMNCLVCGKEVILILITETSCYRKKGLIYLKENLGYKTTTRRQIEIFLIKWKYLMAKKTPAGIDCGCPFCSALDQVKNVWGSSGEWVQVWPLLTCWSRQFDGFLVANSNYTGGC